MPPEFLYFDLGKVLVTFDVAQMYRQIGEVAGMDPARVREVLLDGELQKEHELGRISTPEFYDAFCQRTGTRPDYDALVRAASDIFGINAGILPLVSQLQQAGHRLGVLSNTSQAHWEHCRRRFYIIADAFPIHTLSYEVHAAKPDPVIFRAAAERAGVDPGEIFFVDDIAENVAGALAAGFDAVHYTSAPALATELRQRGLRFNY
jgi:HAD superfamily hydrolase (TIGR01509 family)